MDGPQILGVALVILLSAVLVVAARRVRTRQWSARGLFIATCLAVAVLVAMVVSDWPMGQLARFWASHAVLAAVATTVLLAAVAFLAFEAREASADEVLSEKVTTAGLAGLVDHLVDLDLVLFMLREGRAVSSYTDDGRPLRWLTATRRAVLARAAVSGGDRVDDVSLLVRDVSDEMRADLIAQSVRRVAAGMRDWASLLGVSRDGRRVLVRLGDIRLDLMRLAAEQDPDAAAIRIDELRRRVQLLAHVLETAASRECGRAGVFVAKGEGGGSTGLDDQLVRSVYDLRTERLGSLLDVLDRHPPGPAR